MEELTKNIDDEKFRKEILEEKKVSAEERKAVENGMRQAKAGLLKPHSEVIKKYEKYL
ncbi:hypothetical protein SAMN05443429_10722 [Cruoricaptor ignavus]|uniref:Uncharacterized protein n=1 Tax=Cruoricaptor ignavus TaxID=1118202 RepID=A0A1M6FI75_9FLAO|nr:hypothetical protein [Cruoricaptor ignavus]SHI97373.1 hypothetical protein SAMN05443429_10722 [Cruoricaptor ignavus]